MWLRWFPARQDSKMSSQWIQKDNFPQEFINFVQYISYWATSNELQDVWTGHSHPLHFKEMDVLEGWGYFLTVATCSNSPFSPCTRNHALLFSSLSHPGNLSPVNFPTTSKAGIFIPQPSPLQQGTSVGHVLEAWRVLPSMYCLSA